MSDTLQFVDVFPEKPLSRTGSRQRTNDKLKCVGDWLVNPKRRTIDMRSELRMAILLGLLALPGTAAQLVAQEKQTETEAKRATEATRLKSQRALEREQLKATRATEAARLKVRRTEEAAQRSAKRANEMARLQAQRSTEAARMNARRVDNLERVKARRALEATRRAMPPEGTFKLLGSRLNFNKLVKGAPYSATAVTESTQTLSDGNQIIHRNQATYYRDSEGRTRMEQTLKQIGKWVANGNPQPIVMIADPVAGYYYSLDLNEHKATKSPLSNKFPSPESLREETERQKASWERQRQQFEEQRTRERQMFEERWERRGRTLEEQSGKPGVQGEELAKQKRMLEEQRMKDRQEFDERSAQQKQRFEQQMIERKQRFEEQLKRRQGLDRSLPKEVSEMAATKTTGTSSSEGKPKPLGTADTRKKTESLGKRVVEGVESEGTRTTVTIPAGEIGNTLPIHVVDESWYSRELQVPVMTRHLDPRSGENIFRLTNINRSEPARSLFEVPAGYTIVENVRPRVPSTPREPPVGPKPETGNSPKPPAPMVAPVKPATPKG